MSKYHIDSIQEWEEFSYEGVTYSLVHLNAHDYLLVGNKHSYKFVVTYGLHCFTKDDAPHSIPMNYMDGRESRQINFERYMASTHLRKLITENLSESTLYETTQEKFFLVQTLNNLSGEIQDYKICVAIFKENRVMRIHVTSAFFISDSEKITATARSIFFVADKTKTRPNNNQFPKEARNRYKA